MKHLRIFSSLEDEGIRLPRNVGNHWISVAFQNNSIMIWFTVYGVSTTNCSQFMVDTPIFKEIPFYLISQ